MIQGKSPFQKKIKKRSNDLKIGTLQNFIISFLILSSNGRKYIQSTRTQLHGLARTYTHAHNRLDPSNYNASNWSNRCFVLVTTHQHGIAFQIRGRFQRTALRFSSHRMHVGARLVYAKHTLGNACGERIQKRIQVVIKIQKQNDRKFGWFVLSTVLLILSSAADLLFHNFFKTSLTSFSVNG